MMINISLTEFKVLNICDITFECKSWTSDFTFECKSWRLLGMNKYVQMDNKSAAGSMEAKSTVCIQFHEVIITIVEDTIKLF